MRTVKVECYGKLHWQFLDFVKLLFVSILKSFCKKNVFFLTAYDCYWNKNKQKNNLDPILQRACVKCIFCIFLIYGESFNSMNMNGTDNDKELC